MRIAVEDVVKSQAEAGINIPSVRETSGISYATMTKFRPRAEGARIASERLWGKPLSVCGAVWAKSIALAPGESFSHYSLFERC